LVAGRGLTSSRCRSWRHPILQNVRNPLRACPLPRRQSSNVQRIVQRPLSKRAPVAVEVKPDTGEPNSVTLTEKEGGPSKPRWNLQRRGSTASLTAPGRIETVHRVVTGVTKKTGGYDELDERARSPGTAGPGACALRKACKARARLTHYTHVLSRSSSPAPA